MSISLTVGGSSFSGSVIALTDIWPKKRLFSFGAKEHRASIIYRKLVV